MAVVSAVVRVTVSAAVPPVMVSMLATVAVLAKPPRVSASLPAPRSIEALAAAAVRVTVSAPVPPVTVSMLARRGTVGAVGEGQRVAAGGEVDGAGGERGAEGDGVGAGAADHGLDVAERAGIGRVGQGQLVRPGAEVDLHRGGQRGAKGEVSAAVPPVMVSTLATLAVLAKLPRVSTSTAGAEVDRGVGGGGAQGDWCRHRCRRSGSRCWLTVQAVAAGGQGERVAAGGEVDGGAGDGGGQGDGVGAGAADQGVRRC